VAVARAAEELAVGARRPRETRTRAAADGDGGGGAFPRSAARRWC
jgi:hypothetical protein